MSSTLQGVTDPNLQDIAGSIARLETFQAELMNKDMALARMRRENETLLEASAKTTLLESRLRGAEARTKELQTEKEIFTTSTTQKQVELLHVLSAHREYEKKLLAEVAKLENQSNATQRETENTLRTLEQKVHDGEIYAAHLDGERHKIAMELESAVQSAQLVVRNNEETQTKVGRLEAQVKSLQLQQERSEQNERDLTSRLIEQQTTMDQLTWQVRKLEREVIDGEKVKTQAIERAARAEQASIGLKTTVTRYENEFKASQRLSETLGNEVHELKEKLATEVANADVARGQLRDSTNELYREKDSRKEWAQARLQLLQEICDEESKLQAELDAWDSNSIHYSHPSERELSTMFGDSSGIRSSNSGGGGGGDDGSERRRRPSPTNGNGSLMTPSGNIKFQ